MSIISTAPGVTGLKPFALFLISMTLAGCLSGGGSGSSSPSNPPQAEGPTPPEPETPAELDPIFTEQTFTTEQQRMTGVVRDEMLTFLGVPYAKPPIDLLRFAPPAALEVIPTDEQIAEPVSASAYGDRCPQYEGLVSTDNSSSTSEDCLFLNIFRPAALTADSLDQESLPVMVYLHGGAFVEGSGEEFYDPARLVERDVIVVTLNYRLGALGFQALDQLFQEHGAATGNYGILDQQEAMRWIKANIGSFGGNPNNLTIFGQSAGGHSVLTHVVSPTAEGLFSKAISQSGTYAPGQRPPAIAFAQGAAFAQRLGCDPTLPDELLTCLRGKELADILEAQGRAGSSGDEYEGAAYLPVAGSEDGAFPESIWSALREGRTNPVDALVVGFNREEGQFTVALNKTLGASDVTMDNIEAKAQQFLRFDIRGLDAGAIVDYYLAQPEYQDAAADEKYPLVMAAIETDWAYACNFLALLSGSPPPDGFSTNKPDGTALYGYWFTEQNAPQPFTMPPFPVGAAHTTELRYLWGSEQELLDLSGGDESQLMLAERMLDYWTTFAKTGDPNPSDGVAEQWPIYDSFTPATPNNMIELVATGPAQTSALDVSQYHYCQSLWANAPTLPTP